MRSGGPIPPEHREIARGSGIAAILMFLHIAVVGYLAFAVYYCLQHSGSPLVRGFLEWRAALIYWFPAAFAVATYLPTDNLTKVVGQTARISGVIVGSFFIGIFQNAIFNPNAYGGRLVFTGIGAMVVGVGLGIIMRLIFAPLTAPAREKYKKNASEIEVPE